MQKANASFWIYLAGVAALGMFLGAFEGTLRRTYGDWETFAAVLVYLLALRLVGRFAERRRRQSF